MDEDTSDNIAPTMEMFTEKEAPANGAGVETQASPVSAAAARNQVAPTNGATKTEKVARDFSGIPKDSHVLLERMSDEGYKKYSQLERDLAAGKYVKAEDVDSKLAAAQLAEHPRGFIASEAYEQAVGELQDHGQIMSALKTAMLAAEQGKPFTLLTRDEKGKLVKTDQYQGNPKNKIELQDIFAKASQKGAQLENKIAEIETNHTAAHKSRSNDIEGLDKQLFGAYEGQKEFQDAVKLSMQALPRSIQNSSAASFIAKNMALNLFLMKQLHAHKLAGNQTKADAGLTPGVMQGDDNPVAAKRLAAVGRNADLFGMAGALDD